MVAADVLLGGAFSSMVAVDLRATVQFFNLQIASRIWKIYVWIVSRAKRIKNKSETEILDRAILQLLKAVEIKATKSGKPLRKLELLKQGYSERFVSKVEAV